MAQRLADQCVGGHYTPGDDDLNMKCCKCIGLSFFYSIIPFDFYFHISSLDRVPRFSVGENYAASWGKTINWAAMVEKQWYNKEISGVTEALIDSSE